MAQSKEKKVTKKEIRAIVRRLKKKHANRERFCKGCNIVRNLQSSLLLRQAVQGSGGDRVSADVQARCIFYLGLEEMIIIDLGADRFNGNCFRNVSSWDQAEVIEDRKFLSFLRVYRENKFTETVLKDFQEKVNEFLGNFYSPGGDSRPITYEMVLESMQNGGH